MRSGTQYFPIGIAAFLCCLLCLSTDLASAQSGASDMAKANPSVHVQPVWSRQMDPRWEKGDNVGAEDDGITVEFAEFSADGRLVVTGNGLGNAFVLRTTDGTVVSEYRYISPDDIADEVAFDISGGKKKGLEVECGAFLSNGTGIVLGGNLNGVKVFDVIDRTLVSHLRVGEEVDGLAVSPDGTVLAHAAPRGIVVRSMPEGTARYALYHGQREGVVNSIDFTADGRTMASAGNHGLVVISSVDHGQVIKEGRIERPSSVKSVRFSPGDSLVAAGFSGGVLAVFRTSDMSLVVHHELFYIEAVEWTADGRYLLAGGRDGRGRLQVFDSRDWTLCANPEVQADHSNIEYLDIHQDLLLVAGEDAHVRLFRWSTSP